MDRCIAPLASVTLAAQSTYEHVKCSRATRAYLKLGRVSLSVNCFIHRFQNLDDGLCFIIKKKWGKMNVKWVKN